MKKGFVFNLDTRSISTLKEKNTEQIIIEDK